MPNRVNYDAFATTYERRYADYGYPGTVAVLEALVLRRAQPRVLEVGCGTGRWLSLLRELGARVVAGLDASAEMLAQARTRLPSADLRVGSAEQLPWTDGAFDFVLCNNAIHHFPDKLGFVAEAARVLARGGELLVIGLQPTAVERWSIYDYFEGTLERDEQRYPAVQQIEAWMAASGFEHCSTRPVELIDFRWEAATALAEGKLERHVTSQLSLLLPEQYESGIARVREAIGAAEARGETLWLESKFTLFGTTGVRA
jgi:ubiquinone/menaquinone biosynthesis C-methylase UbiE